MKKTVCELYHDNFQNYKRYNIKKAQIEMLYKVIMSDTTKDRRIELEIEAKSVFDAIDLAAKQIEFPEETELIEAYPVL